MFHSSACDDFQNKQAPSQIINVIIIIVAGVVVAVVVVVLLLLW